ADPPCPPYQAYPPSSERFHEEQNQRHEQHVDDERLDQDETENEVAANLAGRARVARDAFDGGAQPAGLSQRPEGGRERQRETGGDDRPLRNRGARRGGGRFLRVNGRDERDGQDRHRG